MNANPFHHKHSTPLPSTTQANEAAEERVRQAQAALQQEEARVRHRIIEQQVSERVAAVQRDMAQQLATQREAAAVREGEVRQALALAVQAAEGMYARLEGRVGLQVAAQVVRIQELQQQVGRAA